MPATTITTELMARSVFSLAQVHEQQAIRIQAGAIRSRIDQSDPVNYLLITEWNVIGGADEAAPVTPGNSSALETSPMHGVGHALVLPESVGSSDNVQNLATVLMSEASVGNDVERVSVGFTVLNRLIGSGESAVDQVWSAYAHGQSPTGEMIALAQQLLGGQRADITEGATHFYSPISMPKEGQPTTKFDVGGGLELVQGMTVRSFAPSWVKTMRPVNVPGVRPAFYKFYTSS